MNINIKKIKTAINNAIENGKNKFGEDVDYATLKLPLRNGDESSDDITKTPDNVTVSSCLDISEDIQC